MDDVRNTVEAVVGSLTSLLDDGTEEDNEVQGWWNILACAINDLRLAQRDLQSL